MSEVVPRSWASRLTDRCRIRATGTAERGCKHHVDASGWAYVPAVCEVCNQTDAIPDGRLLSDRRISLQSLGSGRVNQRCPRLPEMGSTGRHHIASTVRPATALELAGAEDTGYP